MDESEFVLEGSIGTRIDRGARTDIRIDIGAPTSMRTFRTDVRRRTSFRSSEDRC